MTYKNGELVLESVFDFFNQITNHSLDQSVPSYLYSTNHFENVTGIVALDGWIIVFLRTSYVAYKDEAHFYQHFFKVPLLSKRERANQVPIHSSIDHSRYDLQPYELRSVNRIKSKQLTFRFQDSSRKELIIIYAKFAYDPQAGKLILGLDFNYVINNRACLASNLMSEKLFGLIDFKFKNLVIFLVIAFLCFFPIFLLFVSILRPKRGARVPRTIVQNLHRKGEPPKVERNAHVRKKTKDDLANRHQGRYKDPIAFESVADQWIVQKPKKLFKNEYQTYFDNLRINCHTGPSNKQQPTTSFELFSVGHALKFKELLNKKKDLELNSRYL